MHLYSLDCLKSETGVVERLDLVEADANRLKAMGIFAGQRIELARRGNPMIVKAAGGRVAIAGPIAAKILVRAAVA